MAEFKIQQKVVARHLILISNLCIFGGILFVLWGLAIHFLTGKSLEIWPLRFGISLLFIVLGVTTRRAKDLSLNTAEWLVTAAATVTVLYAFYVTWITGLDPTWIIGTTLIIVGALNYLTGLKQSLTFVIVVILIGSMAIFHQKPDQLMAPSVVLFNFFTAAALGFFSSIQRNRHLFDLIQLETKQNIILSSMREGVILHDASGVIVSINDSAMQILGLNQDEIIGKSNNDSRWKTFFEDGSVCPPEMHPSAKAQATGKIVENFPLIFKKADGSVSWLSVSAVPTFEHGRSTPIATVVTIQDVTDQKLKEEQIRSQEVSLMLASRLSGLGEMAAGIAHEINNPLAIINGRIMIIKDSLQEENVDLESVKMNLTSVDQTVLRIAKIVASMKSLSRQVSEDQFTRSFFKKILDDVIEISRERLKAFNIELLIENREDVELDCHPGLLGQAILNLINNSVDAVEKLELKWIRISYNRDDSLAVLRVSDSGTGIPTELKAKILQPFFTTKEIGKGTGLGLSLVQTIVRTHSGEFSINESAKNTEFIMKLPIHQKNKKK